MQAALDAHVRRGDLTDGLVFDAVRVRLIEIGEAVKQLPLLTQFAVRKESSVSHTQRRLGPHPCPGKCRRPKWHDTSGSMRMTASLPLRRSVGDRSENDGGRPYEASQAGGSIR